MAIVLGGSTVAERILEEPCRCAGAYSHGAELRRLSECVGGRRPSYYEARRQARLACLLKLAAHELEVKQLRLDSPISKSSVRVGLRPTTPR